MNTLTILPITFLFLFAGTEIKKYEQSYRYGGVRSTRLDSTRCQRPGRKISNVRCQLDFTLKDDTLIGRFSVIDPPSSWKVVPQGTFRGVLAPVDGKTSFGTSTARGFEWEVLCHFDTLYAPMRIAKVREKNHFLGVLGNGSDLCFHLE